MGSLSSSGEVCGGRCARPADSIARARPILSQPGLAARLIRRVLLSSCILLASCLAPTPTLEPCPGIAPYGDIRIGVELISDEGAVAATDWTERARPTPAVPATLSVPSSEEHPRLGVATQPGLRLITKRDIAALEPGMERVTLRFLQGLSGLDGTRLPRELGWSYLLRQQALDNVQARDAWREEEVAAEFEDVLQELGPRMLSRPTRHALRELPLVADIEWLISDFKIHNVPTSGAYRDSRDEDRRRYGHVSLRWQQTDGSDPLTVAYALEGWRVGASQETLQFGYARPLGDALWFSIGSRFDHSRNRFEASAELSCLLSARTRMLMTIGNEINAFPGPTLTRMQRPEADGDAGLSVYLETIF